MTSARMRTHGHAGRGQASRTYETWLNMNRRCNEPTNDDFAKYGGRGIKVCEQWATFEGFLADMGERPGRRTLDRIENDGNYEPGNCRWATARQQNQNRSSTRLCPMSAVLVRELGRRGHSARELGRAFGVNSGTIHCVLVGRSWTDAIATLSQRSFL